MFNGFYRKTTRRKISNKTHQLVIPDGRNGSWKVLADGQWLEKECLMTKGELNSQVKEKFLSSGKRPLDVHHKLLFVDFLISLSVSLITGALDDTLSWPFERILEISIFRQDDWGLNLDKRLQKNDTTLLCFTRPVPTSRAWGIVYYILPWYTTHEKMIKTD